MKLPLALLVLTGIGLGSATAANLWTVGIDNNTQFHVPGGVNAGTGGGPMANFVQEIDNATPLPGNPANAGGPASGAGRSVDDDYYFAGIYSTVLDGGIYSPVGVVANNEENVERAFTGGDPNLRFHFNLPGTVSATDLLTVSFDFYTMDRGDSDPGTAGDQAYPARDPALYWDVEVLMNGFSLYSVRVTDAMILDSLNPGVFELTTPTFTLADVNGMTGAGADNYVTLRGTNVGSGSRWMSLDYVQLDATPVPEPSGALFTLVGALFFGAFFRRRGRR